MGVSLAQHFKYARTVGHSWQSQSAPVNFALKMSSVVLAFFLLIKLLQNYHVSSALSLEEARLVLHRPFAVLLVTDLSSVQYQVTPQDSDLARCDAITAPTCDVLHNVAQQDGGQFDLHCVKFATALSIPLAKFEFETLRNRQEMNRLREAKITRSIFEDALAAFFVSAVSDFIRHVKVAHRKWSLFGETTTGNVSVAASRPLVLVNKDGFLLRFVHSLLAKQHAPFLNFLVVTDNSSSAEVASAIENDSHVNMTILIKRKVLKDCAEVDKCHVITREQLTGQLAHSILWPILRNLSIAYTNNSDHSSPWHPNSTLV